MTHTPYGPPQGAPRLRAALCSIPRPGARIRSTSEGVEIDMSDGCRVVLFREPQVSSSAFMAAVVQWARRRGAASIEIENS